ncbi:MAG: hypothetical protein MI799_01395 [Desulfobacterales bacterium]|nr:hypothetical protein [Desulfobacterales bacterium]
MPLFFIFGQNGYLRGLLPRPVIDCQRYLFHHDDYSTGERWHDRTICDYNLVQSWLAVQEWYYRFAEIPFEIDPKTLQRKDIPQDYTAFREAIINMLIHQDYADHSRKAEICHFIDLTKFWNPGDAFTQVKDLLEPGEKETRNPILVTAFRRIGFSESAGWGLRDVFKNWRDLGRVPPEIRNDKSKKVFELTLQNEILLSEEQIKIQKKIGVDLPEKESAVFAYACRKKQISIYNIRDILGITLHKCRTVAGEMVTQGLLFKKDHNIYLLGPEIEEYVQSVEMESRKETHDVVHDDLSETAQKILNICKKALSGSELLGILGYKSRTRNFRLAMADLLEKDLIEMTLPETPKSKNQKYRLTQSGLHLVEKLNRTIES